MRTESFERSLRNRGAHRRRREAEALLYKASIEEDEDLGCTTEVVMKGAALVLIVWGLVHFAAWGDSAWQLDTAIWDAQDVTYTATVSRSTNTDHLRSEGFQDMCEGVCPLGSRASGDLGVAASFEVTPEGGLLTTVKSIAGVASYLQVVLEGGALPAPLASPPPPDPPTTKHSTICSLTTRPSPWTIKASSCMVTHLLYLSPENVSRYAGFTLSAKIYKQQDADPAHPYTISTITYQVPSEQLDRHLDEL